MINIQLTPVVKNILIVNVLLWVATLMVPVLELDHHLAMYAVDSEHFRPWQFISHIFMHATRAGGSIVLSHILMNSLGILFIGPMIENTLGSKRFFGFYILTGLGAAALHLGLSKLYLNYLSVELYEFTINASSTQYYEIADKIVGSRLLNEVPEISNLHYQIGKSLSPKNISEVNIKYAESFLSQFISFQADTPMVGASGSIYGLIAGMAVLAPNQKIQLLFPPIPIKTKWLALALGGYAFYQGMQFNPDDNIGHFAHLGGALIGAVLIYQWKKH
jgi:membrane associated rhomboid family serine protease